MHVKKLPKGKAATISLYEVFVLLTFALIVAVIFSFFTPSANSRKALASASLSNTKQIGLAIFLYANDNDENFVIVGQWHSSDPDAHGEYPKSPYMPWTGIIEMYLKNVEVLVSPKAGRTELFSGPGKNGCSTMRSCALLYPTYGYNGAYLSPSILQQDGTAHMVARSTASVARPKEQVMVTEIWSRNRTSFGATSSGANDAYINFATAEAPDGATDLVPGKSYGRLSWGRYSARNDALLRTPSEGQGTAGVAFRYSNRTPVVFADGHAKALYAEQLALGTDWNADLPAKARNLKNGKYMWDPRGL